MNGTENMFTRIITRVWSDKAEKKSIFRGQKNYKLKSGSYNSGHKGLQIR